MVPAVLGHSLRQLGGPTSPVPPSFSHATGAVWAAEQPAEVETPSCALLLRLQMGVARDPGTGGVGSTPLGGAPFLCVKAGCGPRSGAVAHPHVPGEPTPEVSPLLVCMGEWY